MHQIVAIAYNYHINALLLSEFWRIFLKCLTPRTADDISCQHYSHVFLLPLLSLRAGKSTVIDNYPVFIADANHLFLDAVFLILV